LIKSIVGLIYERYVVDGSGWKWERRLVLSVSETQVFYRLCFDPPNGTHVETEPIQEQVSIKSWNLWSKVARILEKNDG
jgi:hypothetical protein